MDISLRRVIGSLVLLLGATCLVVGLNAGQLEIIIEIVKKILEASVAGAP